MRRWPNSRRRDFLRRINAAAGPWPRRNIQIAKCAAPGSPHFSPQIFARVSLVEKSGAFVCRLPAAYLGASSSVVGSVVMNQRTFEGSKKVIPFAQGGEREWPRTDDQVDKSGQAIISLLDQAARTAKEDCDRAFELAHKLSLQLREAEDRATALQSQIEHFQERALKAENWMLRIYKEIEERFLSERDGGRQEQQYRR
jgi:hypothetical protein